MLIQVIFFLIIFSSSSHFSVKIEKISFLLSLILFITSSIYLLEPAMFLVLNKSLLKSMPPLSVLSSLRLNLSINLLKFSSLNFSVTFSLFHSFIFKSSILLSSGTSLLIVPSVLERYAISLSLTNFSFVFGFKSSFSSSIALYSPSIVLYFFINSNAVFSPIPETPGILSEVSPISPFTSISCFGLMPYFSTIASSSK